jgi:ribonuclease J
MEENINTSVEHNNQHEIKPNNVENVPVINAKKRVFTESEQKLGTYNVGMKKPKTTLNKTQREKVINNLNEINPDLKLENIEQVELLTKNAGNNNSKTKNKNKVKVIFLGGIGEIGKNMTALECGDDMIIIDCGLAFPSEDMPGVDLVIPDFTYVKENAHKLRGIVITHGHEDHIGSLPYLLKDVKAPIYGSKMTLTLLDNKLREHKISNVNGICVKAGYVIKLGCFSVEFVKVNHSIPGAFALSIDSPAGIIFHTGDFKIDYEPIDGEVIDLPRIAEIGRKGVTLMLGESTNVERSGYTISEKRVGENLERVFIDNQNRRIFVATFSSNIYRVEQIIDLAIKYKRRVAVVGRSMINNIDAGMKIGAFKFDKNVFIDIEKISSLEDKNVLVLSTGSQGEPTSALSRLANGEFSKIEIGENDTVIFSSSPIPGNENMINAVINNLYKKGAIVVTENVHASGHACQEELKTIHNLLNPKFFIPVHGEYRHLKEHVILSEKIGMPKTNCLIPEIGNVVEITKNTMVLKGNVQAGEQLVDGLGIGDVGSVVLRDRKLLSEDGLVIVVIGVSDSTGELVNEPYLITRGFVYTDEAGKLNEEAKQVLHDTIEALDLRENRDWNEIRNQIRKPLRNFFYKKTMRTPMILPIIFRI